MTNEDRENSAREHLLKAVPPTLIRNYYSNPNWVKAAIDQMLDRTNGIEFEVWRSEPFFKAVLKLQRKEIEALFEDIGLPEPVDRWIKYRLGHGEFEMKELGVVVPFCQGRCSELSPETLATRFVPQVVKEMAWPGNLDRPELQAIAKDPAAFEEFLKPHQWLFGPR